MEQQVVGVKIESGKSIWKHESDTSIVNEIYRVQEISSEQPKVLENAPGTVTTTMDFPSTSCCMSNTHKEQMELACLLSCNFYGRKKNDFSLFRGMAQEQEFGYWKSKIWN